MQISPRTAWPACLMPASLVLASLLSIGGAGRGLADEPVADEVVADETGAATPEGKGVQNQSDTEAAGDQESSRESRIAHYLTGATFTGQFTSDRPVKSDGDSKQADPNSPQPDRQPRLKQESYTISSCELIDGKDLYRLKVKIRYGNVDGEFPMDLRILWAEATPVITLDSVWIPGLGTFSSRVLIHQNRYAGTWQHDEKGGSLFGTIQTAAGE
ncbi:hypothetical protein [Neorhodopirellula lusitana]|uniref:hypothetical protein n=1 Tax=Neorhodopirellula lusitana TaxID=445327 RepID=UPI00384B19F0